MPLLLCMLPCCCGTIKKYYNNESLVHHLLILHFGILLKNGDGDHRYSNLNPVFYHIPYNYLNCRITNRIQEAIEHCY